MWRVKDIARIAARAAVRVNKVVHPSAVPVVFGMSAGMRAASTQPDKPKLGLDDKTVEASVDVLIQAMHDFHELYVKTRNAHWNIEGPQFIAHHELLEEVYKHLDEHMDAVAERARTLGHGAFIDLSRTESKTSTRPTSADSAMGKQQMDSLDIMCCVAEDTEAAIRKLRSGISKVQEGNDHGTDDLLSGIIRELEKDVWMVRSHLGK